MFWDLGLTLLVIQLFRIIKKISDPYLKIFRVNVPIGGRTFDFSAIIGLMVLEFVRSLLGMSF